MSQSTASIDERLFDEERLATDPETLTDQYKLFVGTTDTVVSRRLEWNKFFITANVLFATVLVGIVTGSPSVGIELVGAIVASVAGLIACVYWRSVVLFYQTLSETKFDIIYRLETRLPAQVYRTEGDLLQQAHGTERTHPYQVFDRRERFLPIPFILLYAGVLLFLLIDTVTSLG